MRSRLVLLAFVTIASAVTGRIVSIDRRVDALGQEKKPGSSVTGEAQLPKPDAAFKGKIGETFKDSKADYPQPVKAPKGAPNVLLILLDDVGFSMTSTFGGPVSTPHLQQLADSGLKYTRFHTTALCSPTRAALLTGRNHHSVGTGIIIEMGTPVPMSKTGGGTLKLFVNGKPAGEGTLERTFFRHGLEPFEVGRDSITPIDPAYKNKGVFAFTGKITKVAFAVTPPEK